MFMQNTDTPLLGSRFEEALVFAARLHACQVRKGSGIPYIAHLLGVTELVLQDGGDEDQAIAALLHDAVEDQGGHETLATIRARFGDRVARIVEGCTDAYTQPKPPWQERKEAYIAHLRQAEAEVRRVSLSDKLHNARSVLYDLRREKEELWKRFNGGKEGTLWYYRTLVQVFQDTGGGEMAEELARVVAEIEKLAADGS
jgi:(p)ppGpp synthase/HD superfamily hydrolase